MDADAEFTEFAEARWRELRRTAYLLCGDWQRAEDATQDALVKVYAAWRRVRGPRVRAYAHRAVATAVVDQSRRPWRRERAVGELPEQAVADPAGPVTRRDEVLWALAGLGPRQRACVVLRYHADLDVAETARVLGVSEGTVKSQTARALDHLRNRLDGTRTGGDR